jgi:predicted ester cyclase
MAEPETTGGNAMATAEGHRALVLRLYQEMDKQNFDGARELQDSGYVAHQPGMAPMDRDGFSQFARMFYAAMPDGHHTSESVLAEGDKVVTQGTFSGTHKGELMGIPPTGKPLSVSVIHIDRVAGSKVAEHWGQADMLGLMQQLGAIPAPGQPQ